MISVYGMGRALGTTRYDLGIGLRAEGTFIDKGIKKGKVTCGFGSFMVGTFDPKNTVSFRKGALSLTFEDGFHLKGSVNKGDLESGTLTLPSGEVIDFESEEELRKSGFNLHLNEMGRDLSFRDQVPMCLYTLLEFETKFKELSSEEWKNLGNEELVDIKTGRCLVGMGYKFSNVRVKKVSLDRGEDWQGEVSKAQAEEQMATFELRRTTLLNSQDPFRLTDFVNNLKMMTKDNLFHTHLVYNDIVSLKRVKRYLVGEVNPSSFNIEFKFKDHFSFKCDQKSIVGDFINIRKE